MIPGGNILNMAMRLIAKQQFTYFAYITRTLQPNGMWSTTYACATRRSPAWPPPA